MEFIKELYKRNRLLATSGTVFLILSILIAIYIPFNKVEVLGINSMIKPLKFALSIWIYDWTLAYLLFYVNDQKRVRRFSILAVAVMIFENLVILVQAFRGKLSHFNQTELVGGILYSIMGILIVWVTIATLILTIRFLRQKTYPISPSFALSIKIGLIMFVIFSFFGGYMSYLNSHNIGGEIGGKGLPLVNWSTAFGDLRVGHFLGIHSLQLIPIFGFFIQHKMPEKAAQLAIWLFSILYFALISYTIYQAISGQPFYRS